jgi:eukaryotic-like serine/threonine-protein kinase
MRAFFRLVLLSLVLLVVALVSALTAMRFAIHGSEVAVPDLTGKTPADARRVAEIDGFQFEIERQYYSPQMPKGRILSQVPPAGTLIRRGWQIRVAESLGPQRVEIPNVLGESERAAEINILRRGLDIGAEAEVDDADAAQNQVIAQSPSPSAGSISAPKINLLAAQPPQPQAYVMPSFVGQPIGVATAAVKDAGLKIGTISNVAPTAGPSATQVPQSAASSSGIVSFQIPPAGSKVLAGSAVSFEVHE